MSDIIFMPVGLPWDGNQLHCPSHDGGDWTGNKSMGAVRMGILRIIGEDTHKMLCDQQAHAGFGYVLKSFLYICCMAKELAVSGSLVTVETQEPHLAQNVRTLWEALWSSEAERTGYNMNWEWSSRIGQKETVDSQNDVQTGEYVTTTEASTSTMLPSSIVCCLCVVCCHL